MMPKLFVAVDVPTKKELCDLLNRLAPLPVGIKIGLEAILRWGTADLQWLLNWCEIAPARVLWDIKLHDTARTMAAAIPAVVPGGWATVHMLATRRGVFAARQALTNTGAGSLPQLLGVTLLTSHTRDELIETGLLSPTPGGPVARQESLTDRVVQLADIAYQSGLGGVIAAPTEVAALRRRYPKAFAIVCPGIRILGQKIVGDDQRRTATAAEAFQAGATAVVIGRPITTARDPVAIIRQLFPKLK